MKKYEQVREKTQGRDDMDIIVIPLTNRADMMSVENEGDFHACVFNVNDHHKVNLFAIIKQIKNRDILLHDSTSSHVTSLHASSRVYDFKYFHGTLSVNSHLAMSADDVTQPSTGGNKAGH